MTKQELRTLFLAKRILLTDEEFEQKSKSLIEKLLAEIEKMQTEKVCVFLPIKAKREFDCQPLIEILWKKGIATALPVANFQTHAMDFVLYNSETKLEEKKFGIIEPVDAKILTDFNNTLVVVPLLIQDENNYRVGYGGGFYDRFFAKHPEVYKVGVSYFDPVKNIEDLDGFDVKLDEVVL